MANDGFEKISEIPLDFIKEGNTFINRCTKPDAAGMIKESPDIFLLFC